MAKKTFKIGESAVGGIIQAEVLGEGKVVQINFREWTSKEIVRSESILSDEKNAYRKIMKFLEDGTTHFYADKVASYIVKNSNVKEFAWWV